MKNRTENISVRYRPQHLTKSQYLKAVAYLSYSLSDRRQKATLRSA